MTSTSANPAVGSGRVRQESGSADQNKPAENNRPTTATQAHSHPLGRDDAPDDAWQQIGEPASRVVRRLADKQRDIVEGNCTTMIIVYGDDKRVCGFLLRRYWVNGLAVSFEAFTADERSLGIFGSQAEAAAETQRCARTGAEGDR
jgi:hypothetical protein